MPPPPARRRRHESATRATNITVSEPLLREARELGLNVSQAAEEGIARALAERRTQLWLQENAAAIQSSNEFVEMHGLPLAKHRLF